VTLVVEIPGRGRLELEYALLDVNGTLSDRGELLDGVASRLAALGERLELRLVSGDTFETLDAIGAELGVPATRVADGMRKLELVEELGRDRCVVVGNGTNDGLALEAAALGIAIVGPEGASAAAVRSADVLCSSVVEALELLLEPRALVATLRL
jgi:P-type E1-E2 ATPase